MQEIRPLKRRCYIHISYNPAFGIYLIHIFIYYIVCVFILVVNFYVSVSNFVSCGLLHLLILCAFIYIYILSLSRNQNVPKVSLDRYIGTRGYDQSRNTVSAIDPYQYTLVSKPVGMCISES